MRSRPKAYEHLVGKAGQRREIGRYVSGGSAASLWVVIRVNDHEGTILVKTSKEIISNEGESVVT